MIIADVAYSAKTALPFPDADRAVSGLRGELRRRGVVESWSPDWGTLKVVGPDEVIGARGRVWYEWTATVEPL